MTSISILDTPNRTQNVRVTARKGSGDVHVHITETLEVRSMDGIPFSIEVSDYYLSLPIDLAQTLHAKLGKALP